MGERLIVKTIRGLEQAHKCLCSRVPPESTATHTHALTSQPREGGREGLCKERTKQISEVFKLYFFLHLDFFHGSGAVKQHLSGLSPPFFRRLSKSVFSERVLQLTLCKANK